MSDLAERIVKALSAKFGSQFGSNVTDVIRAELARVDDERFEQCARELEKAVRDKTGKPFHFVGCMEILRKHFAPKGE